MLDDSSDQLNGTSSCHHGNNITSCKEGSLYFEVPFLILVIVLGTLGNIFVIVVVNVEKTLRKRNGVQFIVNLAVADMFITAWYLPVVLANVLNECNIVLNKGAPCALNAYLSAVCCEVSILSIMCIALLRFIKIKFPIFYNDWIGKKVVLGVVAFIWVECCLVSLPIVADLTGSGFPLYQFDEYMAACMWNDRPECQQNMSYTIFLMTYAVILPIIVTAVSYYNILSIRSCLLHVKGESDAAMKTDHSKKSALRKIKKQRGPASASRLNFSITSDSNVDCSAYNSVGSGNNIQVRTHHCRNNSFNKHLSRQERREDVRDARLTVTILVVLIFYTLCWFPYAIMSLVDDVKGNAIAKRACGWLALSNSAVNSIIYGIFNDDFRQGYIKLFNRIFCCGGSFLEKLRSIIHTCKHDPAKSEEDDDRVYKQNTVTFG